jgi:MerR family transcriptional regulator, light-induced transcriptional regulator
MSDPQDIKHTSSAPGSAEVSRLGPDLSKRFNTAEVRDALSDAIRTIVLPRMLERRRAAEGGVISNDDIATLLACATAADPTPSEALLESIRQRGATREAVLLDLFAPVALRLARSGSGNGLTFADAALGSGRLRGLMRSGRMPDAPARPAGNIGSVFITGTPGDAHALEAAIISDLLQSAGWATEVWSGGSADGLIRAILAFRPDLLCLTIVGTESPSHLRHFAKSLRRDTGRRLLGVVLGGKPNARTAASALGVDAVASDPRRAAAMARSLKSRGSAAAHFY